MRTNYYNFLNLKSLTLFVFLISFGVINAQSNAVSAQLNHPEEGLIKLKDFPNAVELMDKRTISSRVFDKKDGTQCIVSSSGPIHYEKNGVYYSYNTEIVSNNTGKFITHTYVNSENDFTTYLPNNVSLGFIEELNSGNFIKDMTNPRMYFLSNGAELNVQNMNGSSINVNGSKAMYNNVYNGIDLDVSIVNGRRKADYIINSSNFLSQVPANAEFLVFEETVELPSGWSAILNSNIVELHNSVGELVLKYDIPFLFDSPSNSNACRQAVLI